MTKAALLEELEQLSAHERLELGLWPARHRAHPDEPGVTLDDIRRTLTSR